MYSRSRSCLTKGKVPDLVKDTPRPGAQLEFLYPRWFMQPPAASVSPSLDPHQYRPGRGDSFGDHGYAQALGMRPVQYQTGQVASKRPRLHESQQLWGQYWNVKQGAAAADPELREIKAVVGKRKRLAQVVENRLQNRAAGRQRRDGSQSLCHHEILRVQRPKSDTYNPSQKVLRRTLMKARDEQDNIWTAPARILSDAMQLPAQRDREAILLHERTILHLTGTARENAWIHNSRARCKVHVLPRAPNSTAQRVVLLYGSQAAREFTKGYLRAEDKVLQPSNDSNDEDLEEYIQWLPSGPEFDPDKHDTLRPDQLPIPDKWSVKALAQYVEDLCTLRLTRGLQRELFPGEETLQRNVATVLQELFTTDELMPYFSSHAFNLALRYICKHTELGSTRELLYNKAKQLELHCHITIYNTMIEGVLKRNEMNVLKNLVKDMLAAGVVPDGMTWSKLLLVSPSAFARRNILDFIFRVYPDELPAVQVHIAQRLVEKEMVQLVEKSDGIEYFPKRMDSSFGPDWLTGRTLDTILKTCADHQLWQVADEMLELATERNVRMLPSTVKALMYLHYRRGNLNAAIDLLQSPWVLELGYDSTSAVHWAFLTAWRQRRYNICRVLWQYAATRGLISHRMQTRVYESLVRNQDLAALPERQSWEDRAGKLVIGTDLDTTDFATQFPRLSKYFSTTRDPLQWLGQWTPNNGTRDEQLSLAYVMIHRDLTAWKVLRPMSKHDLPELLNAARRKDQAWVLEKFHEHATLGEMLANAIHVPLAAAQPCDICSHVDDVPSLPQSLDLQTQRDTKRVMTWRPIHLTFAPSKTTIWAEIVSNVSLRSSRLIRLLVPMLQTCSRVSSANCLRILQYLAQRFGLQATHQIG